MLKSSDLARPQVQQASPSTWSPRAHVKVIVLFGAVLLAFGAFLAIVNPTLLVGKGEQMNNSAQVFAGYFFSRNLGLAVLIVGALVLQTRKVLGGFVALTALIQFLEKRAVIRRSLHRIRKKFVHAEMRSFVPMQRRPASPQFPQPLTAPVSDSAASTCRSC